jgi:hypothetical protein
MEEVRFLYSLRLEYTALFSSWRGGEAADADSRDNQGMVVTTLSGWKGPVSTWVHWALARVSL